MHRPPDPAYARFSPFCLQCIKRPPFFAQFHPAAIPHSALCHLPENCWTRPGLSLGHAFSSSDLLLSTISGTAAVVLYAHSVSLIVEYAEFRIFTENFYSPSSGRNNERKQNEIKKYERHVSQILLSFFNQIILLAKVQSQSYYWRSLCYN